MGGPVNESPPIYQEDIDMYIILAGSSHEGFSAFGPYESRRGAKASWLESTCTKSEFFILKLPLSSSRTAEERRKRDGAAIIFDGNLEESFYCYGLFEDVEAAHRFALQVRIGRDYAILHVMKLAQLEAAIIPVGAA
jgi:hypothetical protein